jgi:uncharacterized membrane protein
VNGLHRLWPQGWRPDQRTVGLLIFGFYAVAAISVFGFFGSYFSELFNLQSPGEVSNVPGWVRITDAAILVGGLADIVVALGGLALMANLARARVVTAVGLAVAAATMVITLVVAPLGYSLPYTLGYLLLNIGLIVLVMRWQPRRASTLAGASGTSAAGGGKA